MGQGLVRGKAHAQTLGGGAPPIVTVAAAVYELKIFEGAVEEWEATSFIISTLQD